MVKLFEPKRELTREGDGWRLTVTPGMTGICDPSYLHLTEDQKIRFDEWCKGDLLIQEAFPDLDNSQREIILSGIGPEDWDRLFKEPEDESI